MGLRSGEIGTDYKKAFPLNRRLRALDEVMGCWRPKPTRDSGNASKRKWPAPEARSKAKGDKGKGDKGKGQPRGKSTGKGKSKEPEHG